MLCSIRSTPVVFCAASSPFNHCPNDRQNGGGEEREEADEYRINRRAVAKEPRTNYNRHHADPHATAQDINPYAVLYCPVPRPTALHAAVRPQRRGERKQYYEVKGTKNNVGKIHRNGARSVGVLFFAGGLDVFVFPDYIEERDGAFLHLHCDPVDLGKDKVVE